MTFEPVHDAHAIEKVSMRLELPKPIPGALWPNVLKSAVSTANELEFPTYGEAATVQLQIGSPPNDPTTVEAVLRSRHGGVSFSQRGPPPEPPLREFVVTRTELRLNSSVYVRWSGYRGLLEKALQGMASTFFASDPPAVVQLEYSDRFNHPGPLQEVRWTEVLKPSVAVTQQQLERTNLWHSHVGWVEADPLGREILVKIDIDAVPQTEGGPIGLHINTTVALRSPTGSLEPDGVDINLLLTEIDTLHETSKRIFGSILVDEMVDRISLFSLEEGST
jgi:uncharacterized protein (TIGR04255 family)